MSISIELVILLVVQTLLLAGFYWTQKEKILSAISKLEVKVTALDGTVEGIGASLSEHKQHSKVEIERVEKEISKVDNKVEKLRNGAK